MDILSQAGRWSQVTVEALCISSVLSDLSSSSSSSSSTSGSEEFFNNVDVLAALCALQRGTGALCAAQRSTVKSLTHRGLSGRSDASPEVGTEHNRTLFRGLHLT